VVSVLTSINKVNQHQHQARLVLKGHPFVGRHNEYQSKGGDALRLGSKGTYGSCVGGR